MAKKKMTFRAVADSTMTKQQVARAKLRTRAMLAEKFGTTQPEISKIESRADMYVSTLRKYIEAARAVSSRS